MATWAWRTACPQPGATCLAAVSASGGPLPGCGRTCLLALPQPLAALPQGGVAARPERWSTAAPAAAVMGTFAWAAPEQLFGTKCTAKADMYAFGESPSAVLCWRPARACWAAAEAETGTAIAGVVLWEICTQQVPVRGRMRDLRWASGQGMGMAGVGGSRH